VATSQAGDGWDGMCQDCADMEHAKANVDPLDFGDIGIDVLEDDSSGYGLEPGEVFGGCIRLLGTFAHISLVHCEVARAPGEKYIISAACPELQHLVNAARSADPGVYTDGKTQPKWVKLAAWPGRLYLLTVAPGAE
jgi:hypothetical protein